MAYHKLWLVFLWLILGIIGLFVNVTVIWIVLAHKVMRTVTNLFLVNLAIAEGLGALYLPMLFTYTITTSFDWLSCKILAGWEYVTLYASILTLSAIAFERYMAIIQPLKQRLARTKTVMVIVGIWIISVTFSIPMIIFHDLTPTMNDDDIKFATCEGNWPNLNSGRLYIISSHVMSFIVPFVCMVYSYSWIVVVLWKSKEIGEQNENQIEKDRGRKKVIKMLIVVMFVFIICHLPFRIVTFISDVLALWDVPSDKNWYWDEIWMAIFILNAAHPICNPIIYCWMSKKFRTGFKKAFKCLPCVRYEPTESDCHL